WQPEFTDKTLSRKPGAVQSQKSGLADLSVERFLQWSLDARLYSPQIITIMSLIALWSGPKLLIYY
uniref:hypothetical protein n=1 Tax=Escherichia coli TaxID=562 RepID=UPI0031B5FD48